MRRLCVLVALSLCFSTGCFVLMPIGKIVSAPFGKKETFEEIQRRYTTDIHYGLYDRAIERVEPRKERERARRKSSLRNEGFIVRS